MFREPNLDRFNDDAFRNFGRSRSDRYDDDAYDKQRDRDIEDSNDEDRDED